MQETILGGIAFLLFVIYDLEQAQYISRRFHKIVQFFFSLGFIVLLISTLGVLYRTLTVIPFGGLRQMGFILSALLFLILLVYTLFFVLPFQETYVEQTGAKTYDKGVYALCRHPGVLWFAGFYFSLWLAFQTSGLLWMAIWYTGLNLGYIILQDVAIFPRVFSDYLRYQQEVPFLVPTKRSLTRCMKTLFWI